MNYRAVFILCLCLWCSFAHAQTLNSADKYSKKNIDYRESPNPRPVDQRTWDAMTADIMVSFADVNVRYEKNNAAAINTLQKNWNTIAWKGERVHTQFVIATKTKLAKVFVKAGALTDNKGHYIPSSAVTTGYVRYVLSDGLNKEGHGCGIRPAHESDSSLSADGIDFIHGKSIAPYTVQPVWLSVAVPPNTIAGSYTGKLKVMIDRRAYELTYTINVKPHILPEPKDWRFHLDLWQNPYSVARVFAVKDWGKEHFDLMRPSMQMLANAGQKTITVSMIYDPWRGQTYDIYKSMIKWVKQKDGTWIYDYSIFDQWVSYMMELGIDKLINCYTMVPWNNKFYYYDEAAGKDTLLIAKTGTREYEAHWKPMLTDFAKHLKQKRWFSKTAIAMDERPLDDMQKVIALVKSVDKDFKISLAGSYHAEIANGIYDYCIASAEKFDSTIKEKRVALGLPTTYYTYCWEGHPNTFTFSPPAEAAFLGWYAAAQNYNGYLRWAYNCWPQNPMQDARFSTWSSGDTYFVYPGGSSIRFERLIEGIQDYEKIQILKEEFIKNGENKKLQQLEEMLGEFDLKVLERQSAAEMLKKAKMVLDGF
jgi:hypothetical protein